MENIMKTKVHEVAKVLHTHTHTHTRRYYIHLETKNNAKVEKIKKMEYMNLAKV